MLQKDRSSSLKLVILYLFYNVCLKIFFSLFNHLLYIEYPEDIKQLSFFVIKDNFLSTFIENLFRVISSDLFWLLPYTIMNIYIFMKLINYLIKENRDAYQYMSFVILKVYFFWCIVYLCSIGFGFFLEKYCSCLNSKSAIFFPFKGLNIFLELMFPCNINSLKLESFFI